MRRSLCCVAIFLSLTACTASGEPTTPPPVTLQTVPTITVALSPLQATATTHPSPNAPLIATASTTPYAASYPVGCSPAEVETFLIRFLAAFNRGDQAALPAFFPTSVMGRGAHDFNGVAFVWYSMTDQRLDGSKRHFVAYELPALWEYLAERHAQHETLRLASLAVSQQDTFTVNIALNLYRTADDLLPDAGFPSGQATGKAVMNCRDQTLRVISLGQGRDVPATPTR